MSDLVDVPKIQVEASLLKGKDQQPLGLVTTAEEDPIGPPSHDPKTFIPCSFTASESLFETWMTSEGGRSIIRSELESVQPETATLFTQLVTSLTTSLTESLAKLELSIQQEPKSISHSVDTVFDTKQDSDLKLLSTPTQSSRHVISPNESSETLCDEILCSSVAQKLNFDEPLEPVLSNTVVSCSEKEKLPIPSKKDSKIEFDEPAITPSYSQIPQFHYPFGRPNPSTVFNESDLREQLKPVFDKFKTQNKVNLEPQDILPITHILGLPRYLNLTFYTKITTALGSTELNLDAFITYWKELKTKYVDQIALCFAILLSSPTATCLTPDDLKIPVQDVTFNHPGLEFLSSLPVFQNRYMETVIARLFYAKNKNWNKKMTLPEFRKSGFVKMLKNLEEIEDINTTLDIFSYQHFYVIYCRFWELDQDHDMIIDFHALRHYDGGSMTDAILKRVIEGYGKPPSLGRGSHAMSYEDFVWFILSVEDKRTPYAIEYWFRCLDLDGDGQISLHEIQHFFQDQYKQMRLQSLSDAWKFPDFVCSLMDLIKPKQSHVIKLADLKHCRSSPLFFDMLFDLSKYDSHVRRIDPAFREMDDIFMDGPNGERIRLEGFEKFAAKTYEILAREETQQASQYLDLEDDLLDGEEGAFHVMSDLDWEQDVTDIPWILDGSDKK